MPLTNTRPTAELQTLDAAHHMHPFTANTGLAEKGARIITRGHGVWLTDSEGVELLDGMSGLWCVNIGYGQDRLAKAAERQMRELPYYNTFFQTSHIPAIDLAAKIAEIAPAHLNHVFFAGSGSEANDTNLRLARTYWALKGQPKKSIVISRKNAYHGSTLGGASLGGMVAMHEQGDLPIPGIHHINQPNWWSDGGDMDPQEFGRQRARELEAAIHDFGEDRVAAFIAEPVQGAGGVIVPPESYWPEIQRICDAYDILLIADEVICGFGRTGNWFGSETVGWTPDIMTIAKGLSSGYQPIGGSIVSDEIARTMGDAEFNHGYTYSGHPVASAVALENLAIMEEENLVAYVRDTIGPYLTEKWRALTEHPLVGEARNVGLMASIALTPDKDARATFAADAGTAGYICRELSFSNNLIMRHVYDRMIIAPPLVIRKDEVDTLMERVWKTLDQTHQKLRDEGLMQTAV